MISEFIMNYQIDIVIPTFDSAKTIEWTLLNLVKIKEKGVPINVIVVDSGSTDETLQLVERYGFKSVYYPKGNMYAAINHGLRMGNSPWCTYINSDDILYPDAFASLLSFAQKTNADLIYGNIDFIDEDGRFLHSWNSPAHMGISSLFIAGINPIPQPGTIFSRHIYEKLGGFDEKFKYCADYDFFLRASLNKCKFMKYYGKCLAAFRLHQIQTTQKRNIEMRNETQEIYQKWTIKASLYKKIYAKLVFKIRNLPNYIIRVIRWRQLYGVYSISRSTSIKD